MPRVSRSRRLGASPAAIWSVIADPYQLPRWWPGTQRVENVTATEGKGRKWTQVLETKDGRNVRADYRCISSANAERYVFEQLIDGTPFARVLKSARTEIHLAPEGDGTNVTMRSEQKLRGLSRTGGFMMRRASARKLAEALQGLDGANGGDPPPEGQS
ncbi:hypothetical protein BH20ACT15_BH20ACT15_01140 [soil metagenome]